MFGNENIRESFMKTKAIHSAYQSRDAYGALAMPSIH